MKKVPLLCLHCWCGKKVWKSRNKPCLEPHKRLNGRLFHWNCYKIFRKIVNNIQNNLRALRFYRKNKYRIHKKLRSQYKRKTKKYPYFKDLLLKIFVIIPVCKLMIQYRNMRVRNEPIQKKIEILVCI